MTISQLRPSGTGQGQDSGGDRAGPGGDPELSATSRGEEARTLHAAGGSAPAEREPRGGRAEESSVCLIVPLSENHADRTIPISSITQELERYRKNQLRRQARKKYSSRGDGDPQDQLESGVCRSQPAIE